MELSTLADFLAFFFLFTISEAVLLNLRPDERYLLRSILQGEFETCILTLNVDHHLDVILIDSGLMLDDVGDSERLLRRDKCRKYEKEAEDHSYYLGSHEDWLQY